MARQMALDHGLGAFGATRFATALSELARNAIVHGGGGTVVLEALDDPRRLRLIVSDRGPGIDDLELALRDGYSTTGGMGLGLGGAQRLLHALTIQDREGGGLIVEGEAR
ncbi:MAG: ATP-binding protein [Polyangiaceae bacterium]